MDWATVDTNRRTDVPGFIDIVGTPITDPAKDHTYNMKLLLGVSLMTRNPTGVVIGAFGGYRELFNYTGILVEVNTPSGINITSIFAMESSSGDPLVVTDFNTQKGGKAGIWKEHANGDIPTSGRTPLSTLDEVVLNFAVSPAGKIIWSNYFDPYKYVPMGAGGRDLGSSGGALLVSTVFDGTGVSRIAIVIGKMGK
ncbi:putative wsc domain-containing protein [Botrytis fragariae]|uniref:Putative wsc domain-containing protein n=1 Tax=Botrytis fragariae TaxID=1964551 RepID=A0A8H6EI66_9HELO|nr:putative wsc domain-containing protein [Botrytis fragariae]KAF5873167.1 putative wsc domain-containing protein [Botrytis fragariae]